MAEDGEGTSGGTPGGYSHAALIQKGKEKEKELLDRLKEFFVEKGQPLEEGWRVEVKIRGSGTSLGTTDAYYFSPGNKRYRSRMEIARDLGVVEGKEGKGSGKGRSRMGEGSGGGAAPPPLTRDAAIAAARKRRREFTLPRKLPCGVTVITLGGLHPGSTAFCNSDRLWPAGFTAEWEDEKGVRFINSITETPSGPMFRIKAQRLAHEGRPATEVMELGAGPTPDDAYKVLLGLGLGLVDAEERQQEALEIALLNRSIKNRGAPSHAHYDDPEGSPVAPAGRALDGAEHLLVKCRPLSAQWGLERFGLADPTVLQAIEGLPGADQCPGYVFVDERPGGWVAETRRLNAELAAHGKAQVPIDTRRMSAEGSGPRKRPPRPSRKEAEENAVRRVIDGIIKQAEMEEMQTGFADPRMRMKLDKGRDRRRSDRDKLTDLQRLQQKAAYIEAQRRQAELNATVEDTELPNADEPPPEPSFIATGRLPLHQQAVLLEAWQFVSRFGVPLLKLGEGEQLPTLQQLESALLGEVPPAPPPPPAQQEQPLSPTAGGGPMEGVEEEQQAAAPPPDAAVQLQMVLLEFLVGGLFQDTAQAIIGANSDITMADLRGPGKHALHPLAIKQETWQEAARRYLTVLATSALTQAKDSGAAGASSLLAVMDPWVILQYLTAGPPATLAQGAAALPRGASKTAGHSVIARVDAVAVAAAHRALAEVEGGGGSKSEEEQRQEQQLLRCLLKDIIQASKMKKGDGRVLCYGGQAAAAAAKFGRPLDFKCIAARVDAGVYTALPDPLAAFAADVKYAASLYQAACNKAHSLFAQEYLDKSAPELAALAVSKLEQALREIEVTGAADYVAQHAALPQQRRGPRPTPEPGVKAEGGAAPTPGSAASREASVEPSQQAAAEDGRGPAGLGQRTATDAVRDLDRPFAPFKDHVASSWRGCLVCWNDDDPARLLPCDTCDCQQHSYCLEPPLEELPLQTEPFLCPRCLKLQGPGALSGGKPLTVEFARASGGDATWRLAQLLATKEYSEWSVEDRCALLRLLLSLCAESARLHDTLHGEEDEVKDKKKEIAQLKTEVKRLQSEMAAAQQQQQQPAAGGGEGGGGDAGAPPGAAALPPLPPQASRHSARRGRDPAAEIEGMVERISKLEHDIAQARLCVGPVRLEPVGLDRQYNRYWMLPAAAAAPDPSLVPPHAPPLLVVERHSLDSIVPASVEAAAAVVNGTGAGGGGGAGAGPAGWQVGLFHSILHLQQLAQWLNPKGTREKPLAAHVSLLLDQHQQFAMQHAQLPRVPEAAEAEPVDPEAARASAVARLHHAMLSFEEGNQSGTYDELAGSEERRQRWRAMVAAAHTPQARALMAALLVLEGMVRPEYLKPHWRPFSQPAPQPADICTLPAVWLRLEALKTSVKLKLTLNMRVLKEAMGGSLVPGACGTRYSLREPKPMLKRLYYEGPDPTSRAGSADSDGEDNKETRAERAAKRAKQRETTDDEAVARELDAELNPGARRTRHRTAPAHHADHQAGYGKELLEEEWEEQDDQDDSPAEEDVDMEYAGSD
ncbi:hypothetical protein CHLNCDRAFT_54503 [Chlorella variabilis]|uniref:PHD-type domain-containing protein n=1 Tax=Chlorella variabilis TaxID=554065 RepID=E1ZNZ3_CHLVA|nr:hypothetical protein CHLNCDRAFT_54503 [Chlorella variabilis]EFN52450.1 hypothetical protein CHLNCDRAFT_54503 [Chlorella variabilis]|eukprot:XP_005844552.1 hypothetical protein CHLNCDRAFT_54503 [Chlorella variabilis]